VSGDGGEVPYDVFKDDPRYARDRDAAAGKRLRSIRRKDLPVSEWSVKDAVDEFRERYRNKYPQHSPDELGNYVTLVKILGKLRNEGVTVQHMVRAIDDFYAQHLDRGKREYPAWKKWLWKVRDTRPKDENDYVRQQEKQHVASVSSEKPVPNQGPSVEDLRLRLEEYQTRLDVALEDEELYLANHGQNSIATLKLLVDRTRQRIEEGA
jgi:hypothetical protein